MADLLSAYVEYTGMAGTLVCSAILLAVAIVFAFVAWGAFTNMLSDMAYRKEARAYFDEWRDRDAERALRDAHQGDR